ncbi:MAG: hypothetical protein JWN17_2941 [Frankiales bacterium]|nr:hypothetical protein [Frankiales bacterium]
MVLQTPTPEADTEPAPRRGLLDTLAGPLTAKVLALQVLAGLVLGVVVFGGLAGALALRGSVSADGQPRAALLLTGGSLGRAQAQAVVDDLGWAVTRTTYQGAGFGTPPQRGGATLTQQVRRDPDVSTADVVVVQGGEADTRMAPSSLETAALHLLDWLKANTSDGATVVLAGPVPGSEQTPAQLRGVDAVLAAAAKDRGVRYLSAIDLDMSRAEPEFGAKLVAALRRLAPARS